MLHGVHNQETQDIITCRNHTVLSVSAIEPKDPGAGYLPVDDLPNPRVIGPMHSLCLWGLVLRDTPYHGESQMPVDGADPRGYRWVIP